MKIHKIFGTKKGQIEPTDFGKKLPYYIIMTIMLTLMAGMFACSASKLNYQQAEAPDSLQDLMIVMRIINTESCFAYKDVELGRVYSSVIDITKLNQAQMDGCIQLRDTDNCYQISITDIKGKGVIALLSNNIKMCQKKSVETTVFRKNLVLLRKDDGSTTSGYLQVMKYHNE